MGLTKLRMAMSKLLSANALHKLLQVSFPQRPVSRISSSGLLQPMLPIGFIRVLSYIELMGLLNLSEQHCWIKNPRLYLQCDSQARSKRMEAEVLREIRRAYSKRFPSETAIPSKSHSYSEIHGLGYRYVPK